MARLIITCVLIAAFCSDEAHAQVFSRGGFLKREIGAGRDAFRLPPRPGMHSQTPNGYRTPYPTSSRGLSIGVGSYPYYNYPRPGQFDPYRFDSYLHDPYATGRFEAPDLLNDPYFRERHRYDSRFPGRSRESNRR